MELGKKQVMVIIKKLTFGAYLGDTQTAEETVLLPAKEVPEDIEIGDPMEVFLYRDSKDRMIATTRTPLLQMGDTAVLKVKDVGKIGAFLDWGLEKDLFLPFKQQTYKVKKGDDVLVALYLDKSSRLCATMKVYPYLRTDSPYKKEDHVTGRIYETSGNFGIFVAVDDRYSALIPHREAQARVTIGSLVQARVTNVKEDGKLDLSIREKGYLQMEEDAKNILEIIRDMGGQTAFGEKADPEQIRETFGLSKAAFKRALGTLYKQKKVELGENYIKIME